MDNSKFKRTAFFVILVFILVLQLTLMMIDYKPRLQSSAPGVPAIDDFLDSKYQLRPNTQAFWYSASISTNNIGLRDENYNLTKSPETIRIILIGDSTTFGQGIPVEKTYGEKLEKKLNLQSQNQIYEVWNAGVITYNTAQAVTLLDEELLKYEPDFVIYGFFQNDLNPPMYFYSRQLYYDDFPMLAFFDTLPFKNWKLFQFYNEKLYNLWGKIRYYRIMNKYGKEFSDSYKINEKAFDKLVSLSSKENFTLMITEFPYLMEQKIYNLESHSFLHEKIRENELLFVDIIPDLRNVSQDLAHFRVRNEDNIHMSEEGQTIISEALFKNLINLTSLNR